MATHSRKRTDPTARAAPRATPDGPRSGTTKRARNLSLTAQAISRGEAYAEAHGTTVSALVEQYLRGLPALGGCDDASDATDGNRSDLAEARVGSSSPLVRELAGLLTDGAEGEGEGHDPREAYREHLWRRYGER